MGYRSSFVAFGNDHSGRTSLPDLAVHASSKRQASACALRTPDRAPLRPREGDRFVSCYRRSFAPGGGCGAASALRPLPPGSPARAPWLCSGLLPPGPPGPLARSCSEPQLRRAPAPPRSPASGGPGAEWTPWERRRAILELLASPGLRDVASGAFEAHDANGNGRLEFGELRAVLQALDRDHGIPLPDHTTTERLLKRFDVNSDQCLDFDEFFEMLVSALRRTAFDSSIDLGRDFFVTKQAGAVWNNYDCIKKLGKGSFGETYLCKRRLAGCAKEARSEERAVKAVVKSRAKIPVEDIEREIIALRQLDSPHILRLFEWYEDAHHVYLVLDYLRGGTLRDVVLDLQKVRKSKLKEEWIRKVMRQVLEAMAYCHRLRLIHRDLKDENIMLLKHDDGSFSSDPFVVIIDLGIAEMFSVSDPQCKTIGGTPMTMAPEVWNNAAGPKCDVWSVGCILFELLSGQMPFVVDTLERTAWLRLHKRGPSWSLVKTSKPSRDLCRSMLTYREAQRPTMMECLLDEWFKLGERDMLSVPAEQFVGLASFYRETAVKRALFFEIASRLPIERGQNIAEVFDAFDTDRDGSVSRAELHSFFERLGVDDQDLVDKTFDVLDVNQDGSLSFSEMCSGVLMFFGELVEERLRALFFEHWDGKGDGLSAEGLRAFFERAAKLQSISGARSAQIMRKLEQEAQRRPIRFEEVRDLLLGTASSPQ